MQKGDEVVCPGGRARVISIRPFPFNEVWVELRDGVVRWYDSKNVTLYIFPDEQ